MKQIPLEQEDDSQYADHGLTLIAPTASSLSLGIGSFLNESFAPLVEKSSGTPTTSS